MPGVEAGTVRITSSRLVAEIAMQGAELVALRDEEGRDLLWDGDPAFWTGRSPILFPIVGRLKNDRLLVDGVEYPMRQHGLARVSRFALVETDAAACRLRLVSDAASRKAYPFDFELDLTYRIVDATLTVDAIVRNSGSSAMPVSFGFHPAFRWPLPYGAAAHDHAIAFAESEPQGLPVLVDGLLSDEVKPSPVVGRTLALEPHLFDADALIFLDPNSRSVRYGPPEGRGLRVDFADVPQLGIWSKPGAPFVCIEPWHGYASPMNFDGDLAGKPGMAEVPAGASRTFSMRISLDPA